MENVEERARNIHPAEIVGRLLQKSTPMDIPGNMTFMDYGDFVIIDEGEHMNLHAVLTPPIENQVDLFCLATTHSLDDNAIYPGDICHLREYKFEGEPDDTRHFLYQKPGLSHEFLPNHKKATYVALPDDRFGVIHEESDALYEEKMRHMRGIGALLIISSSMLLAGTSVANHIMRLESGPETALFVAGLSAIVAARLFAKLDKESSEHERALSNRFRAQYDKFLEEIGIDPDIIHLTNSL